VAAAAAAERESRRNKAVVAVAHTIVVAAHDIPGRGDACRGPGGSCADERDRLGVGRRLVVRLGRRGYAVPLAPAAA
jgi:hypothetical protein